MSISESYFGWGETASLPGIVTELDLSGTALGYLKKGNAITGENLTAGDV